MSEVHQTDLKILQAVEFCDWQMCFKTCFGIVFLGMISQFTLKVNNVRKHEEQAHSKLVRAIVLGWTSLNLVYIIVLDPIQRQATKNNVNNNFEPEAITKALNTFKFFKQLNGIFFGS